jgi:hypothetical protein
MAKETPQPPETPAKKSEGKAYTVGKQCVAESGVIYEPGSAIKLSDARAKALGKLVTPGAPKSDG